MLGPTTNADCFASAQERIQDRGIDWDEVARIKPGGERIG